MSQSASQSRSNDPIARINTGDGAWRGNLTAEPRSVQHRHGAEPPGALALDGERRATSGSCCTDGADLKLRPEDG